MSIAVDIPLDEYDLIDRDHDNSLIIKQKKKKKILKYTMRVIVILLIIVYIYYERIHLYFSDISYLHDTNSTSIQGSLSIMSNNNCDVAIYGCCPGKEALKHDVDGSNCMNDEEISDLKNQEDAQKRLISFIIMVAATYGCMSVFCN